MSPQDTSTALVVTTTVLSTVAFLAIARALLYPVRPKTIRNPLKAGVYDKANAHKLKNLVYHPDQFPGARDVETPYGSIRVYEFGPEDGEKVLFVHGISTPCITLGPIALGLAKRRYRVMLFVSFLLSAYSRSPVWLMSLKDLFGRGFSDGVADIPHDARLYVSQMLLVLASSPLAWTGTDAFRLVGYSLGGGIAVHFANAFPNLVRDLVLLAPAGLIRAASFGRVSRFLFVSGLVPERILAVATRSRLQKPIAASAKPPPKTPIEAVTTPPLNVAEAEVAPASGEAVTPLEQRVMEYVRWMVTHHNGFVPAFMSSIRFAPLTDQHEAWAKLSKRAPGTTAILLARSDEIIDPDSYRRDALSLVGGEHHVRWRILPGSHDFVMTHAGDILSEIDDMFNTNKV
ncbi:2-hydroxy-6-oxo-6-phenylhexa-2 4-dienoate hydrolase [Fusarium subglutinans]|uniref:2-hydroxy-6-oxo-6-phenylhexa-2 4-dienoate hydrolase n=1 Tax=Gibberella subglutinans TaxID=42677 RepID=A0A8H5V0L2_GIBSU|nr:2-hydroxy-6-oxo-6-phenylhexa-2 4-dienoate hydrolase [Fusarium subglutinans]KAF5604024.1 2-hydroxy-6-oxo-6-phenylhexa-2 4-dienoate hydrolase [Fusarium subglutinans]